MNYVIVSSPDGYKATTYSCALYKVPTGIFTEKVFIGVDTEVIASIPEEPDYTYWPAIDHREERESEYQPGYLDFMANFHFGAAENAIWHNGVEGIWEFDTDEEAIIFFKDFVDQFTKPKKTIGLK